MSLPCTRLTLGLGIDVVYGLLNAIVGFGPNQGDVLDRIVCFLNDHRGDAWENLMKSEWYARKYCWFIHVLPGVYPVAFIAKWW